MQTYLQDLGKISENGQKIKIEISDLSKYKETMWEMQQLIAMYERIINVYYFSSLMYLCHCKRLVSLHIHFQLGDIFHEFQWKYCRATYISASLLLSHLIIQTHRRLQPHKPWPPLRVSQFNPKLGQYHLRPPYNNTHNEQFLKSLR